MTCKHDYELIGWLNYSTLDEVPCEWCAVMRCSLCSSLIEQGLQSNDTRYPDYYIIREVNSRMKLYPTLK